MEKLTTKEIQEFKEDFSSWNFSDIKIQKNFVFKNYSDAITFINRVALEADGLNHHPDLFNSYTLVKVTLNTHDVGGLTQKDFQLAEKIDSVFNRMINS
jgi:4a-hydroxytetrahydrobiopterin dehydratase